VVTIPPPAIFFSFFHTITYLVPFSLSPTQKTCRSKEEETKKKNTHTHTQLDFFFFFFFFFFFTQLQEQNQNPKNKKHLLLALDNEELDDQET
jgi:hypothetical protein